MLFSEKRVRCCTQGAKSLEKRKNRFKTRLRTIKTKQSEKTSKNYPLGLHLGGVWEALGHLLGALGRLLGASWALLGASWALLGASWQGFFTALVQNWSKMLSKRPFGSILGRFGMVLGGFGEGLGKDLGGFRRIWRELGQSL